MSVMLIEEELLEPLALTTAAFVPVLLSSVMLPPAVERLSEGV